MPLQNWGKWANGLSSLHRFLDFEVKIKFQSPGGISFLNRVFYIVFKKYLKKFTFKIRKESKESPFAYISRYWRENKISISQRKYTFFWIKYIVLVIKKYIFPKNISEKFTFCFSEKTMKKKTRISNEWTIIIKMNVKFYVKYIITGFYSKFNL